MIQVVENCLQLRGRVVHHYALLENDGITLIDGGFLSNPPAKTADLLKAAGRSLSEVKQIVLTHGHIDHTLHIAELQQLTGAKVLAPLLDRDHIEGRYAYKGINRVCGLLEKAARVAFNYERPVIDQWFAPGETLPFWDGLEVIPLPGHTCGHVGFYSAARELLLAGDLFSNFHHCPKPPPRIFNVETRVIDESILRADALPLSGGVLLSHCHKGTPQDHRDDLKRIALRIRSAATYPIK
ncbi:MAG: MBL fold metallo-hydrolase [Verrucomicrobiales bacterium]|nr:MBL fold metallo-hydrolase [Verrucomicrobiales bacterium]